MNILIIISLFLGIFARPVFAEEKFVTIEAIPLGQTIIIGQTFPVNVVVETDIINRTFYYLFYGGIGNTTSYIQTRGEDGPILSFDDDPYDWENIPTFTTDLAGDWYLQSNYAYINPNTPPGTYSLYIKLFLPDLSSGGIGDSFVSDPQQITVVSSSSITPTLTSTPTEILPPTPTLIPPTATPVPPTSTSTPTPHNQAPTLTPTPTINMSIFGTSTASATLITPESTQSSDLITQDPNPTFIETGSNPVEIEEPQTSQKSNLLPLILLGSGVIFLAIPLIFLKINKK